MQTDILITVLTALFTIASPLIIAFYKRESWGSLLKTAVPIIVSLVIALFYLWYTGGIPSGGDVFQTILTVYGAQQLVYTTILAKLATILEQVNDPAKDGKHEARPESTEIRRGYIRYANGTKSAVQIWTRSEDREYVSLDSDLTTGWTEGSGNTFVDLGPAQRPLR